MTPTIGRIVHYKLSSADAEDINRRRMHGSGPNSASKDESGPIVHIGNKVTVGETVPMVLTKVWPEVNDGVGRQRLESVNGQVFLDGVFLDGNDTLWIASVFKGEQIGQWDWPPRVE